VKPLRGVLVGCGFFAANHLHAWSDLEDVEIVAVCDRDVEKAEAAAARFGVPRSYRDAGGMLRAEKPDFVDIATTAQSHRELVELAAAESAPAICQKPFALDLADAEAMVEACARAGVPLMVHENFRWQSPLVAVRRALDRGAIGTPTYARIQFRHAYDIYMSQPYLLTEKRLAIMDLGIHLLDLARFFLGEATRLFCRTQRIDRRVAGEDSVAIVLDHEGGAVSLVDFSFATRLVPDPFPQTILRIEGDKGTIELDQGYRLTVSTPGHRDTSDVEPAVPRWGARPWHVIQESVLDIQRHWLDCLRTGGEPATSGRDNLRTLDLVIKAYESAETGRALTVAGAGR
jgi:predicted dehydrogenase